MRRGSGNGFRRRTVFLPCITVALFIAAMLLPGMSSAAPPIGGAGRVPPPGEQTPRGAGEGAGGKGGASSVPTSVPKGSVPGQQPVGQVGPAPLPVTPKPFHIDPALLGEITKMLLNTDTKPATDELEAALKEMEKHRYSVYLALWYYQDRAKKCSNRTFTTEDQKAAGCTGTDTLNQCSQKLFRHCVSPPGQGGFAEKFSKSRQKMLEASERLDKALKEYTAKLKLIPEIKGVK
ncbi:MAG: hypothetical protein HW377_1286 [Actinobacteria bacterium]|nr:hypothetical protein [Actinomycetota bacterium]